MLPRCQHGHEQLHLFIIGLGGLASLATVVHGITGYGDGRHPREQILALAGAVHGVLDRKRPS